MVFTSRIEVFGVKPDFHVSCIINSFYNDLFSQGTCISGRNILVFSEEPGIQVPPEPPRPDDCVQASWQGPFFFRNNTSLELINGFVYKKLIFCDFLQNELIS